MTRSARGGARRNAAVPAIAAVLTAVLLSGCAGPAAGTVGTDPAVGSGSAAGATAAPAPSAGAVTPTESAIPTPLAAATVPRQPAALHQQPAPASAPVRVRVETLGIDMPIEAVGTADTGAMALPANPAVAAWYRYGSGPGSAAGATVVAAHVDSLIYDIGPFALLADAPAGTEIVLDTADGAVHRYAVASVDVVAKPDVPWGAVFDRTGAARLTLVTCGGEFDYEAKRYLSNVIVTAVPVP
ncbi:MAG: class F sortase [Cryobacterium sp.]